MSKYVIFKDILSHKGAFMPNEYNATPLNKKINSPYGILKFFKKPNIFKEVLELKKLLNLLNIKQYSINHHMDKINLNCVNNTNLIYFLEKSPNEIKYNNSAVSLAFNINNNLYLITFDKYKKIGCNLKKINDILKNEINYHNLHDDLNRILFLKYLKDFLFKQYSTGLKIESEYKEKKTYKKTKTVVIKKQKQWFEILNVNSNCTLKELKSAYRKLALKNNFDLPNADASKFLEIKDAYEIGLKRFK